MSNELRVAFLGAGGYAQSLLSKVLGSPNIELVGVCDVSIQSAEEMAQPHGARAYDDFDSLLRNDMHALFVCIPPFAHVGQEIEAAERGIHLFVSKPVSLDLEYARRVNRAIKKHNVLSSVSYMLRYSAPVNKAKDLLQGKRVGLIRGHVLARMIGGGRSWYFKKRMSGGQMVVQSGHLFDVFRYLAGEIVDVCAIGATNLVERSADYDIEDASIAVLRFRSGAIGSITSTVAMPPMWSQDMAFDIVAEDLHLSYSQQEGVLHVFDAKGDWDYECAMTNEDAQKAEVRVFLDAMRTGDPSLIRSPYDDAIKTLKVSLVADQSMQKRQPLKVPAGN
jgi:predicted dehydrogenase